MVEEVTVQPHIGAQESSPSSSQYYTTGQVLLGAPPFLFPSNNAPVVTLYNTIGGLKKVEVKLQSELSSSPPS